jgi:hypothetical protein
MNFFSQETGQIAELPSYRENSGSAEFSPMSLAMHCLIFIRNSVLFYIGRFLQQQQKG